MNFFFLSFLDFNKELSSILKIRRIEFSLKFCEVCYENFSYRHSFSSNFIRQIPKSVSLPAGGYAIDGKRSCGVPFLRSKLLSPARGSSSLFFPAAVLSMRQTPAFFDVVAIVSAFYVSHSHAGHRSLFFDELPLDTRIRMDVFPIKLRLHEENKSSNLYHISDIYRCNFNDRITSFAEFGEIVKLYTNK